MKEASVETVHLPDSHDDVTVPLPRLSWALPVAAAVLIAPLWLTDWPAMPDYPAHLATFYLLAGGIRDAHLSQFYRVEWAFVPNLAAELIVPLLAQFVPLVAASKIFLSLVVAMWVAGAAAIHRALYGRIGSAPLLACFFAYNANFMWGFFNYCFATGLSFLLFAAWIGSESRRGPLRLAGFALGVTAIYFCHLFAVATLLLLITCYEMMRLWEERPLTIARLLGRASPVCAIYLPALLAFIFLKPAGLSDSHLEFNLLGTLDDRASAAIQFTYDRPAYLLFLALLVFFVVGLWWRKITIHPRIRLLLAVLAGASLFTPEWAMGGWGVDLRLPAVLGVLAFATCEFHLRQRTVYVLVAAALLMVGYQAATLAGNWRYYDNQFAEFRTAIRQIAPGSRFVTVLDGDAMGLASDQPYWHMAEFGIIDRSAFTPLLFTTKGQHVIQLQPAFRHIAAASAQQGSPPDISDLDDLAAGNVRDDPDIENGFPYLIRFQCHFDYAVVIHSGGRRSVLPDMLKLRHAGSFFSLYLILPSADCGTS
jgi:hypothetical protein